jgi:hypothetical protein
MARVGKRLIEKKPLQAFASCEILRASCDLLSYLTSSQSLRATPVFQFQRRTIVKTTAGSQPGQRDFGDSWGQNSFVYFRIGDGLGLNSQSQKSEDSPMFMH